MGIRRRKRVAGCTGVKGPERAATGCLLDVCAWTLVLLFATLPSAARADEAAAPVEEIASEEDGHATPKSDGEQEAKRSFLRGVALAEEQRWGEAVPYFERSYELANKQSTLFNLTSSLYRVGRLVEAERAIEKYLAAVPPDADSDDNQVATELRDNILEAVCTLLLEVQPSDAEVDIDGQQDGQEGSTRSLKLDPGRHRLSIRAHGHRPRELDLNLATGEHRELQVELPVVAAQELAVGPTPTRASSRVAMGPRTPPVAEGRSERTSRSKLWWILGSAVAVAVGAVAAGAVHASRRERYSRGDVGGVIFLLEKSP